MTAPLVIRPMTPDDRPSLRQAIIELQDYERLRHPTRLPGEEVADAYLGWMQHQCEVNGVILVAERSDDFIGFVAGWVEQTDNIGETADSNRFGYISGICIMPAFRGQQIAGKLLDAMEQYFGKTGVTRLRINALAVNASAQASYERGGFLPYEVLYEKVIGGEGDT